MSYNINEVINISFPNGTMGCSAVYNGTASNTIKYLTVGNGEGGVMDCNMVCVDASGNTAVMRKIIRFSKTSAGVLTMGTATSLINDIPAALTGVSFSQVAANNNIEIRVVGLPGKDIRWQLECNQNSCPLNFP